MNRETNTDINIDSLFAELRNTEPCMQDQGFSTRIVVELEQKAELIVFQRRTDYHAIHADWLPAGLRFFPSSRAHGTVAQQYSYQPDVIADIRRLCSTGLLCSILDARH